MASVTLLPSAYDSDLSSYASVNSSYPLSNGLNSSPDSDTYAEINLTTGNRATSTLAVKFDMSQVPAGATIDSITCRIKARISNSSPYVLTGVAQLYYGATAMGGEVELGTSAVAQTFNDVGYWDRDRLSQLTLLITCTRGVTMNLDGTTTLEPTEFQQRWTQEHWMLQYDLMFGKGYALTRMGLESVAEPAKGK